MHLKSNLKKDLLESSCKVVNTNMASSLLNEDEDNATRNTQQQQQQNNNNLNESSSNPPASNSNNNEMQDNEAKLKKQNLEERKQELEKLLNEKSWLLQQLQKQECQILNGNFEYMNFNDFIQNLAVQYKQEQTSNNANVANTGDSVSTLSGDGSSHLSTAEEAILRRKPLAAKENHQHLNNNNVLHRRQSEISNRSSEYDNYPQNDNQSTQSEGGRVAVMHGAAQATQQYAAKAALKKRSATVAGTTAQSSTNLQMIRQQHLEQQQQQLLYKQQQQQQQQQQHYHHPQQHLFKQHIEHHQVLMPHLQYATQKFYYTTLQPPANAPSQQQLHTQQQQQYGRYIQNKQIAQQQTMHHVPQTSQTIPQAQHQQLLLTPPSGSSVIIDNISLYSLNSNNVATLHRPAQQQQPIIVQCDKYYLSPTSHHVSHNDGGGFIKSSQNIKEYHSPINSPQHLSVRDKNRLQTSQSNLAQRGATPALDIISLAPSYVSMETIDYSTSPVASNMRWRSQNNLPPLNTPTAMVGEIKSQSSDMLNNNQYYNTALNPPPPPNPTTLVTQNQTLVPPPNVTQVKPFKPLDDISINSYSCETQKKLKPKQWLESSLDGPVIRQTPVNEEPCSSNSFNSNNNNSQTRSKLSSQSLNTSRHYSMSAAQAKSNNQNPIPPTNASHNKLSQSTSYLNQMDFANANNPNTPTPSISQAYNLELSPQTSPAYKYLAAQQKPPARPPPSTLYVNTSNTNLAHSATPTPPLAAALSPDIRIESPVNMTVVQPATFQPYKEVTKPFEMSDFYKYSTKFRQKENNNNNNGEN
ncbi:putative mediator of RNA polymerase II transcription subunit 26 [Calliphora vicina]|uniref:putative mediator of RNA polymerase II transcription subunit 26 n=1 Tax=Calliphora vicina TaxID=7373 RepID=UPI00325C2121